MTGCCCYCLRNNNWVKELNTFCRVPLVGIHPRGHDETVPMTRCASTAISGCRTSWKKLLPLQQPSIFPPLCAMAATTNWKTEPFRRFSAYSLPTCLTKHVTSLNLYIRQIRKEKRKLNLPKQQVSVIFIMDRKKTFPQCLFLVVVGGKRDRCRPTRSPITILPSLLMRTATFRLAIYA